MLWQCDIATAMFKHQQISKGPHAAMFLMRMIRVFDDYIFNRGDRSFAYFAGCF